MSTDQNDLGGGDDSKSTPFFGLHEDQAPVFLTLDEGERTYRAFATEPEVYRAASESSEHDFLAPAELRSGHKDIWVSDAEHDDNTRAAPHNKELSLSAAFVAPSGPDIPAEPDWIEPWSSFSTKDSGMLTKAYEVLTRGGIQCTYNMKKYKVKGTFASLDGAKGKFSIFLYKGASRDFVLEVVRRSGDILLFNSLFKQLKTALGVETAEATRALEELPEITHKSLSLAEALSS
jgi:predicted nucleic acid-binding Zn finger protein